MNNKKGFDKANHTQIPNDLFDDCLKNLIGSELKVLLVIFRKTRGWHKETDRISYSQITELTGLNRESVSRAISGLNKKQLITIDGSRKTHSYEINYSTGSKIGSVRKSNQSSTKIEPITGSKIEHTKETVKETKEIKSARVRISKILKGIPIPPALESLYEVEGFADAYTNYRVYLKDSYNRWPNEVEVLEDHKKLLELKNQGNPPVDVISQTIQGKNKSFYPLRDFDKKKSPKKDDWDQQHLKNSAYTEL